jgi:cyclopropane fatty-acyl-phospholipid synthase-like methyltransferase
MNQLLSNACLPYQATGRANFGWARGKLRYDPMFMALLQHRVLPDGATVMDLGCGRGLLAAWCLAAERVAQQGAWAAAFAPPRGLKFRGVELMAREAECGNEALQPLYGSRVQLTGGDMRSADLSGVDAIAALDVLHYIPTADQDRLLDRIRSALGAGGVFVTRVGDAQAGLRFRVSQCVDRCISFVQGHRLSRMWCRSAVEWTQALQRRGFSVEACPMSAGTPFANVMLVCRVP